MATRLRNGAFGAATALGLLTVAVTGNYEGLRLIAYKDVIGVWTVCQGLTKGIRPGMKFTHDQCDVLFLAALTEHEAGMRRCLNTPDAIPAKTYVAWVSFTYNVGIGAFCKSTLARLANAGDLRGACDQLLKWTRAGGREIKGLVTRRISEHRLCVEGLK